MKKVLVVPTDGYSKERKEPNLPGKARLEMLGKFLSLDKHFDHVAIIGGWPDENEETLAKKYYKYLPVEVSDRVTIVDDSANNTVDDIISLVMILRTEYGFEEHIKIYLITSNSHFKRVKHTMEALKVIPAHIDSKETRDAKFLSLFTEKILLKLTNLDPLWEYPIGWALRSVANRRARAYRLS